MGTISYPRNIWVVRHAEREDNVNRSWYKSSDAVGLSRDNSHLSQRGRQQARECAVRFNSIKVDHVFSSPFDRTIDTSSIIVTGKGIPVKPEPGLCEVLYLCDRPPSFWSPEQLKEKFPLVDVDYIPVFSKHTLPKEGYGDDACIPRLRATMERITGKYNGELLFVGHGASIGAIHEVLIDDFKYVGQASVSKFVETSHGCFKLEFSSDASHLSDQRNLRPW